MELNQQEMEKVNAIVMSKTKEDFTRVALMWMEIAETIERVYDEKTAEGRIHALASIRPLAERATVAYAGLLALDVSYQGSKDDASVTVAVSGGKDLGWGAFAMRGPGGKRD